MRAIIFILSLVSLFISSQQQISAYTMKNSSEVIQIGNINNSVNNSYKTSLSKDYSISFSNTYIYISASNTFIDFGLLSPANPVSRTTEITFNSGDRMSLLSQEDHTPQAKRSFIPDSSCDTGNCSSDIPDTWINSLTYGFGFTCMDFSHNICLSNFLNNSIYLDFANQSKNIAPKAVLMTHETNTDEHAQIIYKVNIGNTQQNGQYFNTITYLAVPTY